jgi:hypothetical protein
MGGEESSGERARRRSIRQRQEVGAHMAARAWGLQPKSVEELFFQNEAVSLCMLIHRRARTMRVVDFRAGPTRAKRLFVMSIARREGVRKVFTLVERDEVQTWHKLGFAKEGSIPCFYKRSDALILGCLVAPESKAESDGERREVPFQSETRIAIAEPVSIVRPAASHELMESTIAAGKRGLRDFTDRRTPAKVTTIAESDARKFVVSAQRSGRALTAFDLFGRDVERRYFGVTVRGGFEIVASIESQSCFGNTFLELLESPRTEAEKVATSAALRALCDKLLAEEMVSCFSLAPSDDANLASVFLHNGFRRTGLLLDHLVVPGGRKDAIVWSRKLAVPSDE